MPYQGKDIALAIEKSVKESEREAGWWVADNYTIKVRSDGKRYVVAPYDGPSGREDPRWEHYRPLVSHPFLFLKFARLAERIDYRLPLEPKVPKYFVSSSSVPLETPNNAELAKEWAEDYGVLGLTREPKGILPDPCGGEDDTVEAFCEEASWAYAALTLYEAATDPGEVNVELVARYSPFEFEKEIILEDTQYARRRALEAVMSIVESKIQHHCFPLLHRDGDRIVQGWGLRSFLGAMWLQMMWLVTSKDAPRRCAGPGCNRIISYEQPRQPQERGGQSVDPWKKNDRSRGYKTRKDKKFCSDTCRVKNWQHKQKN